MAEGRVWVESEGRRRSFPAAIVGHTLTLTLDGRRRTLALEDGRFAARGEEEDRGLFTAPMPGKVTKLLVAAGDRVTKGQPLAVLEAMKMESRFEAPRDGLVDRRARARGRPGRGGCRAARPAGRGGGGMTASDLFAAVPPEVTIVEVGPRDGLQNEAAPAAGRGARWR